MDLYFKVVGLFHSHSKTRRLLRSHPEKDRDASAVGLWVLAGSWARANKTDGFVPEEELGRWDDDWRDIAKRLVDTGLWELCVTVEERGYQFHDWAAFNPTEAEIRALSNKRAEAGRLGGQKSRRGPAKPK